MSAAGKYTIQSHAKLAEKEPAGVGGSVSHDHTGASCTWTEDCPFVPAI